jgi:hypothetical protein
MIHKRLTINKFGTGGMVVHCYPAAGRIFGRNAAPKYLSQCNLWASYQQPVFEMSKLNVGAVLPLSKRGDYISGFLFTKFAVQAFSLKTG